MHLKLVSGTMVQLTNAHGEGQVVEEIGRFIEDERQSRFSPQEASFPSCVVLSGLILGDRKVCERA